VTDTTSNSLKILVYSDDVDVRKQVILALGRRPHPSLPEVEYVEVATEPAVRAQLDAGGLALAVLDGEAAPAGGLGIAKAVKDEVKDAPPIVVLIGRPRGGHHDVKNMTWIVRGSGCPPRRLQT